MESIKWKQINSVETRCNISSFWRAIGIWWLKPHVVNRRLSAAVGVYRHRWEATETCCITTEKLSAGTADADTAEVGGRGLSSLLVNLQQLRVEEESASWNTLNGCYMQQVDSFVEQQKQQLQGSEQKNEDDCKAATQQPHHVPDDLFHFTEKSKVNYTFSFCIRKLLPRNICHGIAYEVGLFDQQSNAASFILLVPHIGNEDDKRDTCDLQDLCFPCYRFTCRNNRISLSVNEFYVAAWSSLSSDKSLSLTVPSIMWLGDFLLPKIAKWAMETGPSQPIQSTPLVPMDKYAQLYHEMKQKYGIKFVKIWPENTDPQKFVHEDVAIATYLLLLFQEERREKSLGDDKKQSFVDLGCGNGLLVHILNSEGHPGKGIDLRRRKIWDLYGDSTHLEEDAIIPSTETFFQDYDWLIGNHSDELTPWIPVMATRSSFDVRYFVLPCCFHDFDRKFSQRRSGESQYRTYLNFVQEVGKVCGFVVSEDRLRIPSTKRVCHVGRKRSYDIAEHAQVLERINKYVTGRCKSMSAGHRTGAEGAEIKTSDHSRSSLCIHVERHHTDSSDSDLEENEMAHSVPMVAKSNHCHQLCDERSARIVDSHSMDCTSTHALSESHSICRQKDTDSSETKTQKSTNNWAPNFKPRVAVEQVKNCSLVKRQLKEHIILEVAWMILEAGGIPRSSIQDKASSCRLDGDNGDSPGRVTKAAKLWRRGGSVTLSEVAQLFDSVTLKQLKSECGGLKTLLKNCNQVFQIIGNKVMMKDWSVTVSEAGSNNSARHGNKHKKKPSQKTEKDKELLYKTKLCWFHAHHPDGCPRPAQNCPFAHGQSELRSRPQFAKTTL